MRWILACLLVALLWGCAHGSRWVPCPQGFQLDAHNKWGDLDGDTSNHLVFLSGQGLGGGHADAATSRGKVDGDYDEFRFGGSVHFGLGQTPDECPVFGGSPRP